MICPMCFLQQNGEERATALAAGPGDEAGEDDAEAGRDPSPLVAAHIVDAALLETPSKSSGAWRRSI